MMSSARRPNCTITDQAARRWSRVFVARVGAEAEDDGWIMSYVYDRERNLSDIVILDARDFIGDPVATIHLPVRVPFGFHGGWAPDDFTTPPVA